MPSELGDTLDLAEWERDYDRVNGVLTRAVSEKALPVSPGGRVKLQDGLEYLLRTAEALGWSDQLSGAPFFRHAKPLLESATSREESLLQRVRQLEDELATCKGRSRYSTPMLDLVNAVIDRFYSSGTARYPKQPVVDEFVRALAAERGLKMSQTTVHAVWAVASDPSQHKGGRTPLRKPDCPAGKKSR